MRGLRAEGPRQRRAHVGKMRTTYTSKSKQQRKGGGREGRREGGREGGADIPRGARGWGPPKSGAGGRSSRRWGRGRNWGEGGREGEEGEGDGETNRNIDCMCSYRAWSFLKD